MAYQFPPDLDVCVRRQLATGRFDNEDDLLRAALRDLERADVEVQAIQEGIDDLQAGRTMTLAEFDRQFRADRHLSGSEWRAQF
jgi:Arc/MetJ-type ribon-helix-helix transcriptional regulator